MNRIWTPALLLITVVVTMGSARADFTTGLEAYWAFDDTNRTDSSGNGYTLTNAGSTNVSYTTDSLAGGLSVFFDSNSHLESGSGITQLGDSASSTIQWWVKPAGDGFVQGGTLLSKYDNDGTWESNESAYYFGDGSGAGAGTRISAVRHGQGWVHSTADILTNSDWHQVVFVNDQGTKSIYIDGVASGTTLNGSGFGGDDLVGATVRLGYSTGHDGSINYRGYMDETVIWSRALMSSEISTLYDAGQAGESFLTYTPVPEPGSLAILGLFGLLAASHRRRNQRTANSIAAPPSLNRV